MNLYATAKKTGGHFKLCRCHPSVDRMVSVQ